MRSTRRARPGRRRGRLPRLGGMARPDGVAIVSDTTWAFAAAGGGERVLPVPPVPGAVARLPLVRGILRLVLALTPLFSRRGATGPKERLLLAGVLVGAAPRALPPAHRLARADDRRRSRHGRMAAARPDAVPARRGAPGDRRRRGAPPRRLVARPRAPSRFAARCGTNFAALLLPVTLVLEQVWFPPAALSRRCSSRSLSLSLTMELARPAAPERESRARLPRAGPRAPAAHDA